MAKRIPHRKLDDFRDLSPAWEHLSIGSCSPQESFGLIRSLFIFGTRPEAIKLCPVILNQRGHSSDFEPRVCVTAQHRRLLDQVLPIFGIVPDHDLNVMLPGQTLFASTSRIVAALEPVLRAESPDVVVVQGDTTTTFCGALAGFYANVPVAHVEAGLRTRDIRQPFPEEINRVLTGRLSSLHFCATEWARQNLLEEGVDGARVHVTGNSGIDAVLHVRDGLQAGRLTGLEGIPINPSKRLIAVTAHRRESFGPEFDSICRALARLARRGDVQLIYPVHPNPEVQDPVQRFLRREPNVILTEPLPYLAFVDLMRRAYLLMTDSGGVQEEGPSLGKPILVLRNKTERPEGVQAGNVKLVGTSEERIYQEAMRLLDDSTVYQRMARVNHAYGDGFASERISDAMLAHFSRAKAKAARA